MTNRKWKAKAIKWKANPFLAALLCCIYEYGVYVYGYGLYEYGGGGAEGTVGVYGIYGGAEGTVGMCGI